MRPDTSRIGSPKNRKADAPWARGAAESSTFGAWPEVETAVQEIERVPGAPGSSHTPAPERRCLAVVQGYSLPGFRTLFATGVTRDERDMYAQGSIMGIFAGEQLPDLRARKWPRSMSSCRTDGRPNAARGKAKIATFPSPTFMKK